MNDDVKPAVSLEEWVEIRKSLRAAIPGQIVHEPVNIFDPRFAHRHVAIANYVLPKNDPRKITRNQVEILQRVTEELSQQSPYWGAAAVLDRLADTLRSLLPNDG